MPKAGGEEAGRSVGVDACTLSGYGTGVPKYVGPVLQGLCLQFPQVHFILYSYTDIHFPDLPNVTKRCSPQGRIRGDLWRNTRLPSMVQRDRVDAFWGPDGMLPIWGLHNVRTVLTVHDLAHHFVPDTQSWKMNLRRALLQRLSVRRANRNIAVSATTSRDMGTQYGRLADYVVFPTCEAQFQRLACEDISVARRELDLPQRFWLCVSTLEPRKNFVTLISAYEACLARGLDLPTLVLVGGDGWKNSAIADRVQAAISRGFVRRLGFVEDRLLPAIYALCEAFLMPSRYEGFGIPILEAQLCGAPVIHGSHGSMVEASGGLGFAVDTDQQSIERCLERLHSGEVPLACRLPSDPSIQSLAAAVAKMATALDLPQS